MGLASFLLHLRGVELGLNPAAGRLGSGYDSGHNSFDLPFVFRWNRGADPRFVERRSGIDASADNRA